MSDRVWKSLERLRRQAEESLARQRHTEELSAFLQGRVSGLTLALTVLKELDRGRSRSFTR